ncbi:MAG: hypothetical protein LBR92_00350, partial [Puniceicoccales bacterium]|nr:hypothetical protein [Puniceicoccales bacterium]
MKKILRDYCVAALALTSYDAVAFSLNKQAGHFGGVLPDVSVESGKGKFGTLSKAFLGQPKGGQGFGKFFQNNNRNMVSKASSPQGFGVQLGAVFPQLKAFLGQPKSGQGLGGFFQNNKRNVVSKEAAPQGFGEQPGAV